MNALLLPGRPILRPLSFVRMTAALRAFGFLATLMLGVLTFAPPSAALEMSSQIGFRLPSVDRAPQVAGDRRTDVLDSGLYRASSWLPITVSLNGSETGEAQLQVTVHTDERATNYTRKVMLTGQPQICRFAVAPYDTDRGQPSLTIQLLQNGKILAMQQARLNPMLNRANYDVLALGRSDEHLLFLRQSQTALQISHYNRQTNGTIYDEQSQSGDNVPHILTAMPETLPDTAQGYDAVDAVVLTEGYPVEKLDDTQKEAIRDYARQGGLVIFAGAQKGSDLSVFKDSFGTSDWKEIRYNAGSFENAPQRIWYAETYGSGNVLAIHAAALNAKLPAKEIYTLWDRFLHSNNSLLFSPKKALAAAVTGGRYNYEGREMADALAGQQASHTLPLGWMTLFICAYIVLIVPVYYLVLKKMDRRELAWVTAPLLVFAFSGISYAVAQSIKGGQLTVHRAVIYEMFANSDVAAGYGQFTLYSPANAAYDISLGDDSETRAKNLSAGNPYRYIAPEETSLSNRASTTTELTIERGERTTTLRDVSVHLWDQRSFALPVPAALGGSIEARVSGVDRAGNVRYTLTNRTRYTLRDCLVVIGNFSARVGMLAPGESGQATVFWSGAVFNQTPRLNGIWNVSPYAAQPASDTPEQTRQRIQSALQETLGTSYSSGSSAFCGFVGWFDAPTLDIRVNGKPAAGEQVTMLYAHLPLPPNQKIDRLDEVPAFRWIPDAPDAQKSQEEHDAQ